MSGREVLVQQGYRVQGFYGQRVRYVRDSESFAWAHQI